MDLKGFGSSPVPRDGLYAPQDHADLVLQAIRDRDLRDAVLVGHSLGGTVALLTALHLFREEPERLAGLVIVSGAAFPQRLPLGVLLARLPLLGWLGTHLIPGRIIALAVLLRACHDWSGITREQVEGYSRPFRGGRDRYGILRTARQILPRDLAKLTERYPELRVPALLIWGSEDRIVPAWVGSRLEEALPDARLLLLKECGHVPPEEYPDETLAAVREFLEGLSRITGGGRVP
jgi:pimeloyl-ACP methyl ester carboxylesterase